MTSPNDPTRAMAAGELSVWEAFRALHVEGTAIHGCLARHMLESDLFATAGDTLEVGGGDGELWRAGAEALFRHALDAGAIHVTDSDPNLVEALRADALFRRDRVFVEHADVERLPYPSQRFSRAIGVHVLHWCQTPDRVARAVREIARVLTPGGHALIVTVDQQAHMTEVYKLMQRARAALIARGVRCEQEIPSGSPRVLPFCVANASTFLAAQFETVRRVDCNYVHLVGARHPSLDVSGEAFFVGYLRALPFISRALAEDRIPEALFHECALLFRAHLATHGTFRMSRRDVIYDCSRPGVQEGAR